MYFIYNILAIILIILALPVFAVRLIRENGFAERLKQSFGALPDETLEKVANKKAIWVHAASVGEIVAASPIVKEIRQVLPGIPIVVSVVTASGYDMAKRIIPEAEGIIFFPLDLPYLSEEVIKKIKPQAFLMVETELWPNFLKAVRKFNILAMMVNGRISDKSVNRYVYFRRVLTDMIRSIAMFCMQSNIDAKYIVRLGADPAKVLVTGNTKFDQSYTELSQEDKKQMLFALGLGDAEQIVVAGSTHKGEEELLFQAFNTTRKQFPRTQFIVAPRDTLRADELVELAAKYNFTAVKRTNIAGQETDKPDMIIIDTIGELGRLYGLGDIVYVGGSLIPHGGHNILEPAAHGKPILVGPHMFNFKETYALFTERGVCLTVHDSAELTEAMLALLQNPDKRQALGSEALAIINENRGASHKSAVYLKHLLQQREAAGISEAWESKEKAENMINKREALQVYLYKLVHGEKKGILPILIIALLRVMSGIYGMGVQCKLALYRRGVLEKHKLPCKVISLGNITVGGTGKTPTAQRLAAYIRDKGYRVVILNRGYRAGWKGQVGVVSDGRKIYMTVTEAGDEAYLLAKSLPGVPVIIGRNRSITGDYAVQHLKAEVIILDDAYQHWQLDRDLDIVLIDTINVFGNNFLLPRGTLREPLTNLNRANAFLLTKVDQSTDTARDAIRETLQKYNPDALIVESTHTPRCFIEIEEWYKGVRPDTVPLEVIKGRSVVPFSAIGNPSSFEQTIIDLEGKIVDAVRYPDHHDYTMAEMQYIMQKAVDSNAEGLITTDKDAVKIPPEFIHSERPLPVYVLSIEVRFHDGYEELMDMIQNVAEQK
ncbi:MAG: putative 3-deoxy-D-manno-octulosonic-acid transferase/tetraacyldisaccharide-P 4-kinase [Firmicutes bacterium]|nr:putative 3-deoxy-D-manno-octulosonic-acid transferase/tetraacyldisaccharide-P 4-kinase [Bacillota bacterium]